MRGGSGSSSQSGGGGSRQQSINVFAHQTLVGVDNNQPVATLLLINYAQGSDYNLQYWGVKSSTGVPSYFTQAAIWKDDPQTSVHVFYDSAQRPVEVRDRKTGFDLLLNWTASGSQVTLVLFDPSGTERGRSTIQF